MAKPLQCTHLKNTVKHRPLMDELRLTSIVRRKIRQTKGFSFSPCVSHDVGESATFEELHDDPELVSHQVAVVHLDHVLVMIVPHDYHLGIESVKKKIRWSCD